MHTCNGDQNGGIVDLAFRRVKRFFARMRENRSGTSVARFGFRRLAEFIEETIPVPWSLFRPRPESDRVGYPLPEGKSQDMSGSFRDGPPIEPGVVLTLF